MSFLHWGMLPWLLPFVSIPIILHLLTLRRVKTVALSTYRFLFDSYVQERRRMKFLDTLLATLRTLFLLFMVMVVCRPAVRHWNALFGNAGREMVMLVDCSASMNASTAGQTSLQRAKDAALKIIDGLKPDDRLTVYKVASKTEEVFSRYTADTEAIRAKLEALTISPGRANFFAAFTQVFSSESSKRARPTVYVFTDLQANGWDEIRDQGLQRVLPNESELLVVHVGSRDEMVNRAVVGLIPRPHRAIVGLPVLLRPRVVNRSKTEPTELSLSIFLDEKEVHRANLTLKPGETLTREYIHTPTEPGTVRGRFEIAPDRRDRFPDDDTYFFTLSVVPQIKILLVNGKQDPEPLQNEGFHLATALTTTISETLAPKPTEKANPTNNPLGKEFLASLSVQDVAPGAVNPDVLRDSAVVILANCGSLNGDQLMWLRDYVANGGGLLVFPGDQVNPDVYNQHLLTPGPRGPGPPPEPLVGVRLGPPTGELDKPATFGHLSNVDFAHPVLSVFEDPDATYLVSASFYRRFPLLPVKDVGKFHALAEFAKDQYALVENRFGDGRVLVAGFPAHPRWGNLPLRGHEFVPLILRLVSHVKRPGDLEAPSVVAVDGAAVMGVAEQWAPVTGKVTTFGGKATAVPFERVGARLIGAFDATDNKGYYTVEVRGGRPEQPKEASAAFAVNIDGAESNFDALNQNQLERALAGVSVQLVDASAEAQQTYGAVGNEREIWRPLIALMFVIIATEFFLATLGSSQPTLEKEQTVGERILAATPGAWVGRMTGGDESDAKTESTT